MATLYSAETAGQGLNPQVRINDVAQRGRCKILRNTITLAAQTTSDIIFLGNRPAGSRFTGLMVTSSVSLGASTISVGIIGTPAKYKALAVHTAVDTPTLYGLTAAMALPALAADEPTYLAIGAASFPGAGTLVVDIFYVES